MFRSTVLLLYLTIVVAENKTDSTAITSLKLSLLSKKVQNWVGIKKRKTI